MRNFLNNPSQIESNSFQIIERELKSRGQYSFTDKELLVVKRVIHTTADFEYADLIHFRNNSIDIALEILKKGCKIYVDTNMIKAGINKKKLRDFNCELINYVADKETRVKASELGVTRSTVSIVKACEKDVKMFVIGNAPTALFTLMELIESGKASPEVIIGVPVGFVGAAESKKQLLGTDIPSISIQGRKGGSTVAVSIMNALFYILNNERF